MESPSDEKCPVEPTQHLQERTMKTKLTKLALIATVAAAGATNALAHTDSSEPESGHWLSHMLETRGEPTANQLAPYGYAASGPAARVVTINSGTKYLNVTRLETVQINVGGKSVTWMFDTLGTAPFPLSKVIPGDDGLTVYVVENPVYRGS
jgi:hypothetical protein